MPIRRRIAVTKRGFALLKRYCPGLIQEEAWCAFVSCIQPFLLVWLSARLINEISAQRRIRVTVLYAAGMLVAQFTCSVLQKMLHKLCEEKQSQMWDWFGKIFSDKQMSMDFSDLENAAVQRQRQQAEENLYMFGNGLAQLVWGVPSLVRSGVNILVSLWMGASLFVSRSGSGLIDHPAWIVILLLCIVLGGMGHSKATIKENEVFMRWCSGTVWFNRAFMFFGKELYMNPERAKDVRIYGQSALASKVLDKLIQTDRENRADIFKMSAYPAAAAAAIGLTNAVCYLFIAVKAFFGAFGAGNAVQYMAALSRLGGGLQELMYLLSDNAVYCLHLQKLFEYLDLPDRMYQGSLTVEKRDDDAYDIEFRNVSFRYPNAGGYALRHISLKLKAGEKLAVVGMNGSGKTTFIKLLCRLYDPTEGEILLNGVNIQKYDYDEYLSLFSVVFQDFLLFSFGLGQNIAASAAYDRERAEACLKKTGFGGRLAAMPGGMETCLYRDFDTGGVEISGGEAQKIALARALYKEAPFIILDEPTAALDPVSECGVYRLFDEIAGSRTAIYISHRLASCRFCDEIAVFHEGRIVQQGTHEQLVACRLGRYYELWNAQAQYYKEQDG